jgi:hypothetical protein
MLTQGTAKYAHSREAAGLIEEWLLQSGIQIDEGPERGGIAGWLDENGKPEFVYLEIAGYYLTTMAWLSSGAASSAEHAEAAGLNAQRAADWAAKYLDDGDLPTRLYLSEQAADWRNDGVFTFDLAMAARGLGATTDPVEGRAEYGEAIERLSTRMESISAGAEVMVSHSSVPDTASIPTRWSTRSGPHHLKAAAAVLRLPADTAGKALERVAHRTCKHWMAALLADSWPCQELHPLLYGLEGILILDGAAGGPGLADAERLFIRLMDLQDADGVLTETVNGGIVRSDVLAQALRAGLLLRGRQYLADDRWNERLDRLADALLDFVQPDGGVLFARNQTISNTWAAMFAHQALYLYSQRDSRNPAPASAFELLV